MRRIILVLFFACLGAGAARAQLFIEEGKVVLAVSGGDRVNKSLTIHNTSKDPVDVKVYWEDFEYQPPYDGTKNFMPAGSSKTSASQWVSFSPQTFRLPAFARQQIDYSVSVPSQVTEGHYGALFFEKAGDNVKTETGVSVIVRVGCLFFIEPKDKSKKAVISDIQLGGKKLQGAFTNQGNAILIPRMTYNIMDEREGVVADRGEVKKSYVPPGATAQWEITLPQGLNAANYTLILNTDLDNGDVIVKEIQLSRGASGALELKNIRD